MLPISTFRYPCVGCRILNGGCSKKQRKRRKKSGGRKAAVTTAEATEGSSSVAVEKKALYVNLRDDHNLILWILQLINQLEKGFLTAQ